MNKERRDEDAKTSRSKSLSRVNEGLSVKIREELDHYEG